MTSAALLPLLLLLLLPKDCDVLLLAGCCTAGCTAGSVTLLRSCVYQQWKIVRSA